MAEIAVVGLGNPLVSDEGIGVRVVAELSEHYACDAIDIIDLGTAAFRIIHLIPNRKKIVVVDCALMGTPPGSIRRFTSDDVASIKNMRHYSLHEGDLFEVIALVAPEKAARQEFVIFGIEPEKMEMGEGISPTLEKKMHQYVEAVAKECGIAKPEHNHA